MKLLHEWRNLTLALVTLLFVAAAHADWNHPPRGRTKGLEHHTFRSAANRTEVGYNVCVPPEYAQDPQRRFPVIYYLHGYDGHESSYLEYANYWRESLPRTGPCLLVWHHGPSPLTKLLHRESARSLDPTG